jgi:hypothetical protein
LPECPHNSCGIKQEDVFHACGQKAAGACVASP